jgi:hypothetical protein
MPKRRLNYSKFAYNPPLDCSQEEFLKFHNSLEDGELVFEAGVGCTQGLTGVVEVKEDGRKIVLWNSEGRFVDAPDGRMGTAVTGGTRLLREMPRCSELQKICSQFNEAYLKACITSQPKDWGDAALLGRQVVYELGEKHLIRDNFTELQKRQ